MYGGVRGIKNLYSINTFLAKYTLVFGACKVLRRDGRSRTMPRIPIEVHGEAREIRLVGGIGLP